MQLIENAAGSTMLSGSKTQYPSALEVVEDKPYRWDTDQCHTFGYVVSGRVHLAACERVFAELRDEAYFGVPGSFSLRPVDGGPFKVVLIRRWGYRGQVTIGAIEQRGRLTYIDGCSDSIICYPARYGDPTLNHLHFPAGIVQTQHTHPSIRLGIVARGGGHAWGPGWEKPLSTGAVFMLDEHELHSFRTDKTATTMDVIAFHPDSDFGPTDQAHPMLNRTYIGANPNLHVTAIR